LTKLREFAATRTYPIDGHLDTAPRAEYSTSRECNSSCSEPLPMDEHIDIVKENLIELQGNALPARYTDWLIET
jgi:hypothetical protein